MTPYNQSLLRLSWYFHCFSPQTFMHLSSPIQNSFLKYLYSLAHIIPPPFHFNPPDLFK
jgi:hypothetical protein